MKKFFMLSIVLSFLLTGCSDYIKEDTRTYQGAEWGTGSTHYELTTQQVAYLFNTGLEKQVLSAGDGTCLTVAIPKFNEGSRTFDKASGKTEFHYSITPPGTYYDEDDKQIKDYRYVSIDYVKDSFVESYDPISLHNELQNSVLNTDEYDSDRYE